MPRLLVAALACVALVFTGLSPAQAQQAPEARFAFVIGNDGYEGGGLKTAANDAGLVAQTLKQAGFDVTGARNLDQDTLRSSFREFLAKVTAAGPAAVSAIYLSGYGLQLDGDNYFVPVGASVARDSDVALNAVRISDLTRALDGLPGHAHIVMLDLAYAGPFAKQGQPLASGLAIVDADSNSIIAFNAAPGEFAPPTRGNYGPYAQALSETMRIPGLPLNDIFARARTRVAELTKGAQIPWDSSKVDETYTLIPAAADAPTQTVNLSGIAAARAKPIREFPAADAYAAALDRDTIAGYEDFIAAFPTSPYAKNVRGILAARREALTWRKTFTVNTPDGYWSYLRRYPRGPHAADARRLLARLAAALEPPTTFAPIDYDIPPPPPDEVIYFEQPVPVYYDADVPPPPDIDFYPPEPQWWRPPPPPPVEVYEDQTYFLPVIDAPPPPPWFHRPAYVVDPPVPGDYEGARSWGPGITPYVAIPAALAAGIVAGKLIGDRRHEPGPASRPGGPGAGQPPRQPFLPPVSAAPRPVGQLAPAGGQTLPERERPGAPGQPPRGPQGQAPLPGGQGQPPLRPGLNGAPGAALPGGPGAPLPGERPGAGGPGQPGRDKLPGGRPGVGVQGQPQGQPGSPLPTGSGRPPNGLPGGAGPRPGNPPGGVQPQGRPGPGGAPGAGQINQQQQQLQNRQLRQQQQQQLRERQEQQRNIQQQQLQQRQQRELQQRNIQQQQLQQQRQQQELQQRNIQQQQIQQRQNQQQQQQLQQQRQQQELQQRNVQQQQLQQRQNQLQQQQQMQQRQIQQQPQRPQPQQRGGCGQAGQPPCR